MAAGVSFQWIGCENQILNQDGDGQSSEGLLEGGLSRNCQLIGQERLAYRKSGCLRREAAAGEVGLNDRTRKGRRRRSLLEMWGW